MVTQYQEMHLNHPDSLKFYFLFPWLDGSSGHKTLGYRNNVPCICEELWLLGVFLYPLLVLCICVPPFPSRDQ